MVRSRGSLIVAIGLLGATVAWGGIATADVDFSETCNGVDLVWEKAVFQGECDCQTPGTCLPFGLALPQDYTPGSGEKYPLVIYLHGTDARGYNDNANLKTETARFFAELAQTDPQYNAFILSPQAPGYDKFVDVSSNQGPYVQSDATLTDTMSLTEQLIRFLSDPANNTRLAETLGINADDIDTTRLYIVGESLGAYGVWDTLGRGDIQYAGAIAVSGSGPVNRIDEILETPLWVIHGQNDKTAPNSMTVNAYSASSGSGTLGMLIHIDPTFDNTVSTVLISLDNPALASDDPDASTRLIYTQYPSGYSHDAVATHWTTTTSGVSQWLFAQQTPEPATVLLLALGSLAALRRRPA